MTEDAKLTNRVITFEVTQRIRPWYLNVTDEQTDGQTDGRLTIAILRDARCAWRGKNRSIFAKVIRKNSWVFYLTHCVQSLLYCHIGDNLGH